MDETIDYAEVGLKVGLEVHQQLLTERKLFCNCPGGLYTTSHDGEVLRHMRPTLSELGEYGHRHRHRAMPDAGLRHRREVHIARKQYLDGSIPTGFQRPELPACR